MPRKPKTYRPPGLPDKKQQRRRYDQQRGSSAQRLYGAAWQRARKAYLDKHPLCVHCMDRTTPATEVDHIIPHRGDYELFWNEDNWQALCKTHHSQKTAREDGAFGRKPKPRG